MIRGPWKMRIESPEQAINVQEKLFLNGCEWLSGNTDVMYEDELEFLTLNKDMRFGRFINENSFKESQKPEITYNEFMKSFVINIPDDFQVKLSESIMKSMRESTIKAGGVALPVSFKAKIEPEDKKILSFLVNPGMDMFSMDNDAFPIQVTNKTEKLCRVDVYEVDQPKPKPRPKIGAVYLFRDSENDRWFASRLSGISGEKLYGLYDAEGDGWNYVANFDLNLIGEKDLPEVVWDSREMEA